APPTVGPAPPAAPVVPAAPVAAPVAPAPAPAPAAPALAAAPPAPPPAIEAKPPQPASADQPAPAAAPRHPHGPVAAAAPRQGENIRLTFPFAAPTPAAVFRRADTLWLVFDTEAKIDVAALANAANKRIRGATVTPANNGQVVRIALDRPQLASFAEEGTFWSVNIGDIALEPTRPLGIVRNANAARPTAIVPFEDPRTVYRLSDPDAGD